MGGGPGFWGKAAILQSPLKDVFETFPKYLWSELKTAMRYIRNTFETPIENNLNTLETPFKQPRNTHETPLNPFKHLLNTFKHLLNTLGARFKHPCDTLETALEQLLNSI